MQQPESAWTHHIGRSQFIVISHTAITNISTQDKCIMYNLNPIQHITFYLCFSNLGGTLDRLDPGVFAQCVKALNVSLLPILVVLLEDVTKHCINTIHMY